MSKCQVGEITRGDIDTGFSTGVCDNDAVWVVIYPWDEVEVCNDHLIIASEIGVMGSAKAEVHVRKL